MDQGLVGKNRPNFEHHYGARLNRLLGKETMKKNATKPGHQKSLKDWELRGLVREACLLLMFAPPHFNVMGYFAQYQGVTLQNVEKFTRDEYLSSPEYFIYV